MKKLLFVLAVLAFFQTSAQHKQLPDKQKIMSVLAAQQASWNRGNLEDFMSGYWESDSLTFIGKKGITKGWKTTLANYKKSYPDKSAMGQLSFDILSLEMLSPTSAYVVGKWKLKREKDELSGHFTLLWRKINHQWVIVADHSS